ncbi:hypothetical protein JJB09_22875 [Rhizobium sp. KVB221]|uniref:Uncharacterized protein n=1 Tax=Rhizobium setariae TaxID=2801340 RepID=A0A936YTV0_9HYPH|nr:hypothetical protein [Rhizobium setariae]MBL0374861.1 hypothetical protein [Rhizobium setariae]
MARIFVAMIERVEQGGMPAAGERWLYWPYLLFFLAGIYFYIGIDLVDGQLYNGDPDDVLRMLQVQALWDRGGWYNLTLPRIFGPEPYLSPWSRLVDLPYILFGMAVAPFVGQDRALDLAFQCWPIAMAAIYGVLCLGILRQLVPARGALSIPLILLILILSPFAIWEFSPGRVDHHNVQMLLLLATAYGVCLGNARGAFIAGAVVPIALAVGLETLPMLAVALIGIVVTWCLNLRNSSRILKSAGLASLLSTVLVTIAVIPPRDYFLARPDAFSAPFAMALLTFGILALVLPTLFIYRRGFAIRAMAFGLLGAASIGGIVWLYPTLLGGPFPMIDPLVHAYWFDRINQEKSALQFLRSGDDGAIVLISAAMVILIASIPAVVFAARRGKMELAVFFAICVAALLLTFASNRTLRTAMAILPLLLPVALAGARQAYQARGLMLALPAVGIGATGLIVGLLYLAIPVSPYQVDAPDALLYSTCEGEDFSPLNALPPSRLLTPPSLGLQILSQVSDQIAVSSVPFHRSAPAISRFLRGFMTRDAALRAEFLDGYDYLAFCRAPTGLPGEDKLPLLSSLMAGNPVPGLTPMAIAGSKALMLFKIDNAGR